MATRPSTRRLTIYLVLAVVAALSGPHAVATVAQNGTLTIRYSRSEHRLWGKRIGSDGVPCSGELIAVTKVRPGADRKIGEDTTDPDGLYEVPVGKVKPGQRFRAKDVFETFNDCAAK